MIILKETTYGPVYHGSNEEFITFDKSKIGTKTDDGDYGAGFYFDKDINWAYAYAQGLGGNVKAFELTIENPFITEYGEPCDKLLSILAKVSINHKINTRKGDGSIISVFDFVRRYGSKNFTKLLQNLGYDGVIISNSEYVVFEPYQIKMTNNNY